MVVYFLEKKAHVCGVGLLELDQCVYIHITSHPYYIQLLLHT
jgi:hypothetical protein